MPRPRKTVRPVKVQLQLPEDLVGEVSLILFSEVHGRIPLGKLSEFFELAARSYIEQLKGANYGTASSERQPPV